jgi:hypothetical protein
MKYIFAFLTIVISFLVPIKPLILIVGATIFLDTIFGVVRALKIKEAITSRRLSRIVSKIFLYECAIILFFCIEKYILNDIMISFGMVSLLLTKIVATMLVFVEVLSITENYKIISGVNIWDKLKEVFRRTSELKNDAKKILNS